MSASLAPQPDSLNSYLPIDRLNALAMGGTLSERTHGAALLADISGFTALTTRITREMGSGRGSEEITRLLNRVFDAVVAEVHRYGGSVISFGGDAITCWFNGDCGLRAAAAGLAIQRAMPAFAHWSLAAKVAITCGPALRLVVGDPQCSLVDALAGATLDRLAHVEMHASAGQVLLDEATADSLEGTLTIGAWLRDAETGARYGVVSSLRLPVTNAPWPALDVAELEPDQVRPWLLPSVYTRLQLGQDEFLAELRPVVVLFVHFTGIDYDADDDAKAKLDAFVRHAQAILAEHEGTLLQLMFGDKGSTLYAAFGAPIAHEDDARRAAQAALDLNALTHALPFISCVRIGVGRGIAYAGAYGGRMRRTYGVLGDAVNLAARLMEAAAPGQILASTEVYQDIACTFHWQPLSDLQVKGKREPIAAYALLAGQPQQWPGAIALHSELPLIGREREMALIQERLDLAERGRGQVVGIVAEPGMGKSRLAAEIVQLTRQHGWLCYAGECSPSDALTPYFVWSTIWRRFFALGPSWPVPAQLQALEAQVAAIDSAWAARLPLLGAVVDLPMADNALTSSFDARLRKSSLEALLVDCLRFRSQQSPLLILLEDCHWLDPLSHELLDAIARAIINLPVLVLMTYRTPQAEHLREPRVTALSHFVGVELEALSAQETQQLVADAARSDDRAEPLPEALARAIAQRAEGNPFFAEELVTFVRSQRNVPLVDEALIRLDLPASLQSLILSRIDRLAERQRITLKVASIIGRQFELPTLWGYFPHLGDERAVQQDVQILSTVRLLEEVAEQPVLVMAFRHALIQETVCETLTFAQRAALHEQLAQFIERAFADQLDHHLDLLAFHYDASQNEAKKREYLLKAGRHAQQVYANAAAIDYCQRVLPLLPPEQQPEVLLNLGRVLELVGRWQEARTIYEQALALARQSDNLQCEAWCQTAIGEMLRKQGSFAEASNRLTMARRHFEQLVDQAGIAQVLHTQGTLANQQGDLEAARQLYEQSLTLRLKLDDRAGISGLYNNLGIVARHQGEHDLARRYYVHSIGIRQELGDRWGIAVSLNNLGHLHSVHGDHIEAVHNLEEALAIFRQIGDRWAIANTLTGLGDLAVEINDYDNACRHFSESLIINSELNDRLALAYVVEALGCLTAAQGMPTRALLLVGAAAALRTTLGAPLPSADLLRLSHRLAPARAQLGEQAAQAAEAAGQALSLDETIELALHQEICPL